MSSVLQPWLEEIPIRMQSTLILGLRGPDTHAAPNVKAIGRWLRGLAFKPGNPDNVAEFMKADLPERIREKGPTAKELEFCSQHYYSHLMHALEVVAMCHSDKEISGHAGLLYMDMCDLMHLPMESIGGFWQRLGPREWPGGGQPNDAKEALELLESLKKLGYWTDLQNDGTAMHFTPAQKAERENFVNLLRQDLQCRDGQCIRDAIQELQEENNQLKEKIQELTKQVGNRKP